MLRWSCRASAKRKLGELYATIAKQFFRLSASSNGEFEVIKLRFDKGFKSLKARVKIWSFQKSKRK
jgi:hypothetical protein